MGFSLILDVGRRRRGDQLQGRFLLGPGETLAIDLVSTEGTPLARCTQAAKSSSGSAKTNRFYFAVIASETGKP